MESDAIKRFGNRVEYYAKYRPHYPMELLQFLEQELKLQSSSVIADIGSGTGILSELFLKSGYLVYCIEPNAEMRHAAELHLRRHSKFISVDGTAEATGLPQNGIDFIVAAQAFHWFDRELTKTEFIRISKPSTWVLLLWNDRREDTPFAIQYESLLKRYAIDYETVDHRLITNEALVTFFGSSNFGFRTFENQQIFDIESLQGRVMSCSYMPMPHQSGFTEMMDAFHELFERFQVNGTVTMRYNTLLYYGKMEDHD
jgi:ubiquinone/menaquinone biosynthesis C-methylase UbiE